MLQNLLSREPKYSIQDFGLFSFRLYTWCILYA